MDQGSVIGTRGGRGQGPNPTRFVQRALEQIGRWRLADLIEMPGALIATVVAYCLFYGVLLYAGDFVPYVFDNNESFSALNHARNLVQYGVAESSGLADEAVSPSAAAHPFVHTHQGNFPRLYAALLQLVGIGSIEAQIAVTTFTIGLAALVMAFTFFRICAGTSFALVACLVLMTDYIFFAQWQVNTYRVWIAFFIFSSLLTAEKYAQTRRLAWLGAIMANSLAMFYFEFSFVFFVSGMVALYMAWSLRESWLHLLLGWFAYGLGGALSLGLLVLQVVDHLGWEGFLTDARLTFFARNFGDRSSEYFAALKEFYGHKNVVFFYNVSASSVQEWWRNLSTVFVGRHMRALTPFVSLMVVISLAGYVARAAADALPARWIPRIDDNFSLRVARAAFVAVVVAFLVQVLWISEFWSLRNLGNTTARQFAGATATALIVGLGVVASLRGAQAVAVGGRPTVSRLVCASLFLLFVVLWLNIEDDFYDQVVKDLWSKFLALPGGLVWYPAALIASAAAWVVAILLPPADRSGTSRGRLGLFIVCGVTAAIATYALFPGYLHTGYLERGETVLLAQLAAVTAFALFAGYRLARQFNASASLLAPLGDRSGFARKRAAALKASSVMAAYATAMLAFQWVYNQTTYIGLMPPNQFSWLKLLKSEKLQGKSVVSNTYATPFAITTGSWGYIDAEFASGGFRKTTDGFVPPHSDDYVWLADARTNPAYARPDLFVCFSPPTLPRASIYPADQVLGGCRTLGLVRETLRDDWRPFKHKLLAIDRSPWSAWAIVKLDWNAAPFLRPLKGRPGMDLIGVTAKREPGGGYRLDVTYRYAQQDGHSESGSVIRVYRASRAGVCAGRPWREWETPVGGVIAEVSDSAVLSLPKSVGGPVIVSVQPTSAHREGQEKFSDVVVLRDENGDC